MAVLGPRRTLSKGEFKFDYEVIIFITIILIEVLGGQVGNLHCDEL